MLVLERSDILVANMFAQHGLKSPSNPAPLNIEALRECLQKVAARAMGSGASVHMPRIGCGLGGGKWSDVEQLIAETMPDVEVYVYDLTA